LWNAVVSSVPLLDMLRYDQFLMAKFWVPEYGSAEDPEQFQWLRAYSPYHNIKEGQQYPAMLIVAGENDSRVHPLHARKFTARMQWATRNHYHGPAILLRVDRDAGHGQGKPLSMRIKALADTWAFVMAHTGLCESSSP
jgi:prolyl oligopeptidase